ncbi:MAG TPA: hypothetical protein VFV01_09070 [Spirillospora sp.]|nr:hypothetical protein [Spirillospora sp.]
MGEAARGGGEMVVKQDLAVVAEVRPVTGQWGLDDFVPCLVASEFVTNALRYASASDDDVTFRQDVSCVLPCFQRADTISEAGWGLFIVDRFCCCRGVRPVAGDVGKVAFAVLDP